MNIVRRAAAAFVAAALPLAVCAQAQKPATAANSCKGPAPKVRLTTTSGPIVLELNREKAPVSTENFVKYVESGHYNGTIFHRVIDGFMIQGGGMTRDMQEKPTQAPIRNESTNGLKNDAYTIAMARTQDPNSATAQFYINVANNDMLNYAGEMKPGYAVFGKVVQGRETVDKIKKAATRNAGMHENVPRTPIVIEKAECL
jgi:cyclophilin family peptidyl-prolyl cis-trans isomerase